MGLLSLPGSGNYANTSESQADLGTATTLGYKLRVSGSLILSGGPSGSVVALVYGGGGTRAQVIVANAGGTTYVIVAGPAGADAVAAVTASSNYSPAAQYDIRTTFGALGRSVEVVTTSGTPVASGSDTGLTLANNDAGNGRVQCGSSTIGVDGTIDGHAIYSGAPPANGDPPRATDSGILWAVLDDEVGQLVAGATELDTLSGASWGAGGTWDPPAGGTQADPAAAAAALTPGTPTVEITAHVRVDPAAAEIEATPDTAGVVVGDNVLVAPDPAVAVLAPDTADVAATAHVSVSPEAAAAEATPRTPDLNVFAPGAIVWGVLGDSQSDEYQGTDDRGPAGVLNWVEILVTLGRIFAGEWGTRSEPRRTGYEFNWARSGAQTPDILSDQLAPLAAQVAAGTVTHTVVMATGNDWLNPSGPLYALTIYGGDGTEDSEGELLTDIVSLFVGWYQTIMDAIDEALDTAESGGGMVILTPQDYLASPPGIDAYPDATRRGWVTGVIEAIHAGIASYAGTLNSAAGYTRFSVVRGDEYLLSAWATDDDPYVTISGARVDYGTAWEYDPETYDPYLLILASTGGLSHAGTLMGGEYARAFVQGANQLQGIAIPPLANWEILEVAGIEVYVPALSAIGLAAGTPTVEITAHQAVVPPTAAVAVSAETAAVDVTAHVTVRPEPASLVAEGETPGIVQTEDVRVDPETADMVLTPDTPTVASSADVGVEPATAEIVAETETPSVSAGDDVGVEPAAASILASPETPDVFAEAPVTVAPDTAALMLAAETPSIGISADRTLHPEAAAAALSAETPEVSNPVTVSPESAGIIAETVDPDVAVGANLRVDPDPVEMLIASINAEIEVTEDVYLYPDLVELLIHGLTPDLSGLEVYELPLRGRLQLVPALSGRVTLTPALSGRITLESD